MPPVTFPAWSSFMTGVNPGKHGVFDFTRRVPGTYEIAFVSSRDRRRADDLAAAVGRRAARRGARRPDDVPAGAGERHPGRRLRQPGDDRHRRARSSIRASFHAEMVAAVGAYTITDFQELTIGPGWHDDALAEDPRARSNASATSRRYVLAARGVGLLHGALRRGRHREPSLLDVRRSALAALRSGRWRGASAARSATSIAGSTRALAAIVAELPRDATIARRVGSRLRRRRHDACCI